MKEVMVILLLTGLFLYGPMCPSGGAASWSGVDETVIEKVAEEAGRKAHEPLINTDQGDLPLFVFLVAGMIGGFIGGYNFRILFPSRRRNDHKTEECPGSSVYHDL